MGSDVDKNLQFVHLLEDCPLTDGDIAIFEFYR